MTPTPGHEATLPARGAGATLPALRAAVRRLAALVWSPPPRAMALARDATLALRPGRAGLSLRCTAGCFLVTQEGDPADHLLEPGGVFETRARGRVAAWALEAGTLTFFRPDLTRTRDACSR